MPSRHSVRSVKAPSSPVARGSTSDVTSLCGAVLAWQEVWDKENPRERIRRTPVPDNFGDAIQLIDNDAGLDSPAVAGASVFMPCIRVPGLPAEKYPEYLGFLYRATMAATRAEHPGLYSALDTPMAYYLAAVIVAVRVGVWSSTKRIPALGYSALEEALHYDAKRDRLWLQGASVAKGCDMWRAAYHVAPVVRPGMMEVMLLWCKVAPLVLCTACTGLFALSNTYSTPFVDEAISRYMRSTASQEACVVLRLDRAVVWDAARAAAVEGLPERLVHAWTDDPLLAVTAERRIMTSEQALHASRLRGERVLQKLDVGDTVLNLVSSDPGSVEHQKALWEAVARAKSGLCETDDDSESVATALMEDSSERMLGLSHLSEIEEVSESGTATPHVMAEPPEVSLADRRAVADIIRNAHSTMEQPASVAGNMESDLPLEW
jgi:hypothetical protein